MAAGNRATSHHRLEWRNPETFVPRWVDKSERSIVVGSQYCIIPIHLANPGSEPKALDATLLVFGELASAEGHEIDAAGLHDLGYPIAHVEADGSFIVTKTPDTPGCVTLETVKEQLLYEIHDPANYLTPDVVADFTTLKLEAVGKDQELRQVLAGS